MNYIHLVLLGNTESGHHICITTYCDNIIMYAYWEGEEIYLDTIFNAEDVI